MHWIISLLRNRRGQSITEFALILPFLLVLIGGVVDFGIAFFIGHINQNAARQAARFGATIPPDDLDGNGVPDFGNPQFPAAEEKTCTFRVDCDCTAAPAEILREAACNIPNALLFDKFTITSQFIGGAAPNEGVRVTITGTHTWFLIPMIATPLPLLGFNFPNTITITRATTARWEWQPVT